MRVLVGTTDGLVEIGGASCLGGAEVSDILEADAVVVVAEGRLVRVSEQETHDLGVPAGHVVRCVAELDGDVVVGTDHARLFRRANGSFQPLDGFDRAPGRDSWYTPWGGPPDTRSLSVASGIVYANVHVGGVLRSADGGRTWEQTIDPDTDVHEVSAHEGIVLAALGAGGAALSRDQARTWEVTTSGLHATYCRAITLAADTVLVSASIGPRGDRSAVYRRQLDDGVPFERCDGALPDWFDANIDTRCLAARGDVVVIGTAAGEIHRSDDRGATWETIATGLAPVRCVRLDDSPVVSA